MSRLFLLTGACAALLCALSTQHSVLPTAAAQEPKAKTMTVRWYGQSFFQITDSAGHVFAFDPHAIPAFGRQMVKADFVIVTHPHDDHSLIEMIDTGKLNDKKDPVRIAEADVYRGVTETKTGKQDWKVIDAKRGNIRIRNVATYHDTQNGLTRGKNSIFIVEVDGLTICHLGDLGHELTDTQVKAIGKVDVLMVPIGGIYTINGEQAQAVMKQLKPRLYVFPMHYGVPGFDDLAGPEEFLDGQKNVKKLPATNEFTFPIDAKPETPTVVMLGWKKAEEPVVPPKKK
jgi:L-ascorbate metabolism protein UlaG (beta-lactamase superfamily)